MAALFVKILNMSISASVMIGAVVLIRLLLRKAPRYIICILWALVALRLAVPFTIESPVSLVPSEPMGEIALRSPAPSLKEQEGQMSFLEDDGPSALVSPDVDGTLSDPSVENPHQNLSEQDKNSSLTRDEEKKADIWQVLSFVWLGGVALMLSYGAVSYIRLRMRVSASVETDPNVRICDRIHTPFILGLIKPKIYMPSSVSEENTQYIIAHEKAHLRRLDHIWKPLGFLLLSVNWFNPVVWIAYILLCRDIELACDERVVKEMEDEDKKLYSEALLFCSAPRRAVTACPLAFGEVGVKGRIKNVLNYKKPAFWIIVVALLSCIATAVLFMTERPFGKDNNEDGKKANVDGITVTNSGSDHKGLDVDIISAVLTGEEPMIEIEWKNETDIDYMCGEDFYIYRYENGEWVDVRQSESYYWYTVGYLVQKNNSYKQKYPLSLLDMSKKGKYRFESGYTVHMGEYKAYTVRIEFELDKPMETDAYQYFNATVLKVYENQLLVTPFEGEAELACSDKIYVNTENISENTLEGMTEGSKIRILYDSMIQETYPAIISGVYKIYGIGGEIKEYTETDQITNDEDSK